MALFSRHQVIYTDGAWDEWFSQAGGCGFAFFSASRGCWEASACSLGVMKSALECELAGILCALQHCVNEGMGTRVEVTSLQIKTDCVEAWGRIDRAQEGYPLWPGAISTQIIKKILVEILVLRLAGVAVSFAHIKGHASSEGNKIADGMATDGKEASRTHGKGYLEWKNDVHQWSWQDRDLSLGPS